MHTLTSLSLDVLPLSIVTGEDAEFCLARDGRHRRLAVLAKTPAPWLDAFEGERSVRNGETLLVGPIGARNAEALRSRLPWLRPVAIGLRTSAGLGDRLGLATTGHVRAMRSAGCGVAPVFAQQSIREMARTGRTPLGVMDDAMWGVFGEGWRLGFGSDADHLKTPDDIDRCVAAGFTGFTIDPGDFVDASADTTPPSDLAAALERLPWDRLEDTRADLVRRYVDRSLDVEGHAIASDAEAVARAAVKYGRAVAHVAGMYRHLAEAAGAGRFELEVSVDETETPTSHTEHCYIAGELKRLGVRWAGLAPRYIGRFEKGVDYIGDVGAFERDLAVHAAIARRLGPYKLSLHSGSDKFAIYGIAERQTRGLVHLKTAGTSYLEALRATAARAPDLFREVYAFSRERYETDRATYHVSATLDRAPLPGAVAAADLPSLLDQFDARQILHVTFGSVLTSTTDRGERGFHDRLMTFLEGHPEEYATCLEAHFRRHLEPFSAGRS